MFPRGSKLLTARSLHGKWWFSSPVRIQTTYDMTLHLEERVHICHILRHWLRRLYRYSLLAKKRDENLDQNDLARKKIYMVEADSNVDRDHLTMETQEITAVLVFSEAHVNRKSFGRELWPVISTQGQSFIKR